MTLIECKYPKNHFYEVRKAGRFVGLMGFNELLQGKFVDLVFLKDAFSRMETGLLEIIRVPIKVRRDGAFNVPFLDVSRKSKRQMKLIKGRLEE